MPNRWTTLLVTSLLAGTLQAQVVDEDAMRETLAPTGTLRAAFLGRNPVQIQIDPQTGHIGGPAADVARALASRLGVELEIQPLSGVPAVIEAVENGAADIVFIAHDTTRAQRVDFTQAYIYGHNSYIVPTDSPIETFAGLQIAQSQRRHDSVSTPSTLLVGPWPTMRRLPFYPASASWGGGTQSLPRATSTRPL